MTSICSRIALDIVMFASFKFLRLALAAGTFAGEVAWDRNGLYARSLCHRVQCVKVAQVSIESKGAGVSAAISTPSRHRTLMAIISEPSGPVPRAKDSTPHTQQNR